MSAESSDCDTPSAGKRKRTAPKSTNWQPVETLALVLFMERGGVYETLNASFGASVTKERKNREIYIRKWNSQTGNGPCGVTLNEVEKKVLALMGEPALEGIEGGAASSYLEKLVKRQEESQSTS